MPRVLVSSTQWRRTLLSGGGLDRARLGHLLVRSVGGKGDGVCYNLTLSFQASMIK